MPQYDSPTWGHVNGNPTKTATIAKALNIAKADIDQIFYLDLLVEHDPTRWLSDEVLRFLGELREATDPRYDILKARAAKLAGIMEYMLDTHISRVIATQQGIDRAVIEDELDDLLVTDLPEPRWAIQELLPEGLTILGGKKNAGKSMIAFNLALAVGTGRVALGMYPVEQGNVLFYALEDSRHRIQKRARQMLTGWNGRTRITIRYKAPRTDQGVLKDIEDWMDAHPEARLVVIDLLARIRPTARRNSNAYQDDYDTIAGLQTFAHRKGISILIVHHTRKASADDPFDELNGTTGLLGAADGGMIIRRQRGAKHATLHVTGKDLTDYLELAMEFDTVHAMWTARRNPEEYGQAKEQGETLEALKTLKEPFGPQDLAATLDLPYETAQKRLVRLYHKGLLERPKRGQYKHSCSFMYAKPPEVNVSESGKSVSDCPNVQNGIQTVETEGTGASDNISDNLLLSESLSETVSEVESINSDRFGQLDS
jgi:predicted transcriptional regulator